MKYLKFLALITILLILPVTIFASKTKSISCEQGLRKNAQGICEEIKAPEFGKLNRVKDDFECERGYRKNFKDWKCDKIELPENAVLTVAGNDWRCIPNYRRDGDRCVKVDLPENAKFFVHGSDWYCNFGYEKQGGKCIKLEIPTNARWGYDGNDWECNKGFKEAEDGKSCIELKIPEDAQAIHIGTFNCNLGFKKVGDKCERQTDITNGYFYTTGSDFYCAKGFRKNESERKCEEIKIPENAHRDDLSLEGWNCNREYRKEGRECKKFTLPEHAFWTDDMWKCEQGYRKNPDNKTCDKISIPENARSADTYDGWLCNSGYTKNYKENRCNKI